MTTSGDHATLLPRRNSLNTIRLVLALSVIFGHADLLADGGRGPYLGSYGIGTVAVFAFFGISGYLITKSWNRYPPGRYLWHRFLRIFPGLWVVLLLTAMVAAPLTYLAAEGTIAGFQWTSAADYFVRLATLIAGHDGAIDGTLTTSPTPEWNGPIWTLLYEFLCYLGVMALGAGGIIRRRWPLVVAFVAIGAVDLVGTLPGGSIVVGQFEMSWAWSLGLVFLAGVILAVYEAEIPRSPLVGVVAGLLAATLIVVLDGPMPLAALPMTYALLVLAGEFGQPEWIRKNDLSYGVYIYGWPVAQILALIGADQFGWVVFALLTVPVTLAAAWASWRLVEHPALELKDARPGRRVAA